VPDAGTARAAALFVEETAKLPQRCLPTAGAGQDIWCTRRAQVVDDGSLAQFAATVAELVNDCAGELPAVVQHMGGTVASAHMNANTIQEFYGGANAFDQIDELLRVVHNGAPVDVTAPCNFQAAWERGNYPMANDEHARVLRDKVLEDVRLGRAVVMPVQVAQDHFANRLHLSPVFVVDEGPGKHRVVHDLSAEDAETGMSVNSSTNFEAAPAVRCGTVFKEIIEYIWGVRQQMPNVPIMISKMDVKSAFRQIPINLDGPLLGYRYKDYVVLDLRLPFGWRSSPGWWSVAGLAIEWAVREKCTPGALIRPSPAAQAACAHVQVIQPAATSVRARVPRDPPSERWSTRAPASATSKRFAKMYVDDLIMVRALRRVQELLEITAAAAHAHMQLLGEPDGCVPCVVSPNKMVNWSTCVTVLGWEVDTEAMVVRMPEAKLHKVRDLLQQWSDRTNASAHVSDVSKLAGTLYWAANGVRAGRYFVWKIFRLLAEKRSGNSNSKWVHVSAEIEQDLEFWRWVVSQDRLTSGVLQAPIAALVKRPPSRVWLCDASHEAIGGLCMHTGRWWRYKLLPRHMALLYTGTDTPAAAVAAGQTPLHINTLELISMVLTVWVLVVGCGHAPAVADEAVLLRNDNMSAVSWAQKGGNNGIKDPRVAAGLRLLGIIEVQSKFCLSAKHIAGLDNHLADGITRWEGWQVQQRLEAAKPSVPWREWRLTQQAQQLITQLLDGSLPQTLSALLQIASMRETGGSGVPTGA
jgi:hypothetical protein